MGLRVVQSRFIVIYHGFFIPIDSRTSRASSPWRRLAASPGAAADLHLTQPCVSLHIKELESDLGLKLFVRVGRRIEITDGAQRGPAIRGGDLQCQRSPASRDPQSLIASVGLTIYLRVGRVLRGTLSPQEILAGVPQAVSASRYPVRDDADARAHSARPEL